MIPSVEVSPGHIAVLAPLDGIVLSVAVAAGDQVAPGDELLVIESMKMEHPVQAEAADLVQSVPAAAGATVTAGSVLLVLAPSGEDAASMTAAPDVALDHIRADLAEVRERHRIGLDEARARRPARRAMRNWSPSTTPGVRRSAPRRRSRSTM
jgi:pyruvate/2-oxoglutarate dehydrogenase complex dihydrolipoamide acyltransferase (E2) component